MLMLKLCRKCKKFKIVKNSNKGSDKIKIENMRKIGMILE